MSYCAYSPLESSTVLRQKDSGWRQPQGGCDWVIQGMPDAAALGCTPFLLSDGSSSDVAASQTRGNRTRVYTHVPLSARFLAASAAEGRMGPGGRQQPLHSQAGQGVHPSLPSGRCQAIPCGALRPPRCHWAVALPEVAPRTGRNPQSRCPSAKQWLSC